MRIAWVYEGNLPPSSAYVQQLGLFADALHPFGMDSVIANVTSFEDECEALLESVKRSKVDLIVTIGDSHPWGMAEHLQLPLLSWFVWGDDRPISVEPYPLVTWAPVSVFAEGKFGTEFPVRYVPHGFSANVFHPGRKKSARARIGIDHDYPVVVMVSTNLPQGTHEPGPDRKNWAGALEAFKLLLKDEPKALLYVHANAIGGVNIAEIAMNLGIGDSVLFADQRRFDGMARGFDATEVADVYRAGDVLLMPSLAEGFGLPLIEAQACGIPVVTTKAGPMSELVKTGASVESTPHPMRQAWSKPDPEHLAESMGLWLWRSADPLATSERVQQYEVASVVEDNFLDALEACMQTSPHGLRPPAPKPTKLDIGSGGPGMWEIIHDSTWTTIDKYVGADIQADMWDLPVESNSIDEIWSSHTLEHAPRRMIRPTLDEWYRVLKPGGKLSLVIPNFDYAARNWLEHGGWDDYSLDIIWGSQIHEGEFHKMGWNHETLWRDLEKTGFVVESMESLYGEKYRQESIETKAVKPK